MKPVVKVDHSWKITEGFLEKLKELNNKRSNTQLTISSYVKELQRLCLIDKPLPITQEYKRFLGGFILGEGSLNTSLKKKSELKLGVALDLEFSVTQSFFQVSHLINLLLVFQTGRFDYKSGSNATMVFTISNRQTIFEKVFPFWKKYILPFQPVSERKRFQDFQKFEELFNRKAHLEKKDMVEKLLPLWDLLRKQKGQKNQVFASLEDAIKYINKSTNS